MNTSLQSAESASLLDLPQPSGGGAARPSRERLDAPNFLLVYEDLQTGLRAKEIMDQLADQLGCGGDVQPRLFRFDLMRVPGFLEWTVAERESTDFLVLCANSGSLPDEVNAWLSLWLLRKDDRCRVLVIAFAATATRGSGAAATLDYFYALAETAGAQVFAQLDGTPARPTPRPLRRWTKMMPTLPHEVVLQAAAS